MFILIDETKAMAKLSESKLKPTKVMTEDMPANERRLTSIYRYTSEAGYNKYTTGKISKFFQAAGNQELKLIRARSVRGWNGIELTEEDAKAVVALYEAHKKKKLKEHGRVVQCIRRVMWRDKSNISIEDLKEAKDYLEQLIAVQQ